MMKEDFNLVFVTVLNSSYLCIKKAKSIIYIITYANTMGVKFVLLANALLQCLNRPPGSAKSCRYATDRSVDRRQSLNSHKPHAHSVSSFISFTWHILVFLLSSQSQVCPSIISCRILNSIIDASFAKPKKTLVRAKKM